MVENRPSGSGYVRDRHRWVHPCRRPAGYQPPARRERGRRRSAGHGLRGDLRDRLSCRGLPDGEPAAPQASARRLVRLRRRQRGGRVGRELHDADGRPDRGRGGVGGLYALCVRLRRDPGGAEPPGTGPVGRDGGHHRRHHRRGAGRHVARRVRGLSRRLLAGHGLRRGGARGTGPLASRTPRSARGHASRARAPCGCPESRER